MTNKQEIWKPIENFEGYEISNFGKVRSFHRMGCFKYQEKQPLSIPLVMKCHIKPSGYVEICLMKINKNKGSSQRIHRLVAKAFIPNPENKPQVNHKDGNKTNNHVDNLEWVTCFENISHAFKTLGKKNCRGEKSGVAKLTEEQILEIREQIKNGLMPREIAQKFGINKRHVYKIKNRELWTHI